MGRQSVAEKICSTAGEEDPRPGKLKLVIYDFAGKRIPSKFFDNLRRVFKLLDDGWAIQYSVIAAKRMSTALSVAELARHYKCKDVKIYAVEELA